MNTAMITVIGIAEILLDIIWWLIIVQVIFSWLLAFNILNLSSGLIRSFVVALDRFTAPLYRPLRRILPDFGGLDFSPLIILLAISLIESRLLEPLKLSYQFAAGQ